MLTTYRDKGPHTICVWVYAWVCVCVCEHACVYLSPWCLPPIASTYPYQMLTTYGDKAPHHLCACVCVYVCVYVCMYVCVCVHVCVSVNMESTTYRIHLALPNANNLQILCNTPFVCVCARVCVGVHACVCFRQHGVYHLSYPPSLTKC